MNSTRPFSTVYRTDYFVFLLQPNDKLIIKIINKHTLWIRCIYDTDWKMLQ